MAPKQHLLTGQDALMICPLEHRIGNTLTCCIEVSKVNSRKGICKTLTQRIGHVLTDPSHYLRARQNLRDMRYYYYTQEDARRLAKRIIRRSDRFLTHLELGGMLVQSEMSAIICVHKNTFSIAVTHLFIDGVHMADLIGLCLDQPIIDWNAIPTFRYTPVLQEVSLLPGMLGMMSSISGRQLSVDSDWKYERTPIQHKKYATRLCRIKRLKEYLNTRHTPPFGYTATLAVISAIYVLENCTKDSLNVGLAAGFQSETRFNNFSAAIIHVRRPSEWQSASLLDKVHAVAMQVHRAMTSHGKASALVNYLVTNVYNVNWYTNDLVDGLVSCAPTPGRAMFHGREASLTHVEIFGTTVPLYIGFWTSNACVRINAFSRSRDLQLERRDTLQIDEMLEEMVAPPKTLEG